MKRLIHLSKGLISALFATALPLCSVQSQQDSRALCLDESVLSPDRLRACDAVLLADSNDAPAHRNRGAILSSVGQYPLSLAAYQAARRAAPHDPLTLVGMGATLGAMGRSSDAITALQQAIALDSTIAEAYLGLAGVHLSMRQLDDALRNFRAAVRIAPESPMTHFQLALMLAHHENVNEAVSVFETLYRLPAKHAWMFNEMARVLHDLDRREDAIRALKMAAELKPDNPKYHWALASILEAAGRCKEAIAEFRSVAVLDSSAAAWGRAAKCAAKVGLHSDAVGNWRKALALDSAYFRSVPEERKLWEKSLSRAP